MSLVLIAESFTSAMSGAYNIPLYYAIVIFI